MRFKKQIVIALSAVIATSCIPAFVSAGVQPDDNGLLRVAAGVHKGEVDCGIIGQKDKRCSVKVTTDDNGVVTDLEIENLTLGFSYNQEKKDIKKIGKQHFIGKTLKYVMKMDADNNTSAHVYGNKEIGTGKNSEVVKVVQLAVMKALGYDLAAQFDSKVDKELTGDTEIELYKYRQKVRIGVNKEGRIVTVEDNGTNSKANYVTSDNEKRITLFEKGNGKIKFIGKNAAEIKEMDISKHGMDSIAGATYSAKAERASILKALSDAKITEGKYTKGNLKEFDGVSKGTSEFISGNHVKVKIFLDEDGRIEKIQDNKSYPAEMTRESLNSKWNEWDKFAKYRGLGKFIGMNKSDVDKMDMSKPDSIHVAGKQTELSKLAKEAVLDAFSKVKESEDEKVLDGEATWTHAMGSDPGKKCAVKVTVDKNDIIKNVEVIKKDNDFSTRQQWKAYETGVAKNFFVGKTLKYVLKMDTDNPKGAHVTRSREFGMKEEIPANAVKRAVLNALKHNLELKSSKDTNKILHGEAITPYFGYMHKVKATVNEDGFILKVEDDGTTSAENKVRRGDSKRVTDYFEKGNGYEKYVGKKSSDVRAMDITKHGIDSIAGATYTANAAREAVLDALKKGGFDDGKTADAEKFDKMGEGKSEKTSADIEDKPMKVKIFLDKDGRIAKIKDNGTYPTPPHSHDDTNWDKFAGYRGLYKFIGMKQDEVEKADVSKKDSLFVAGNQVELSSLAKDAIIDAFKNLKPAVDDEKPYFSRSQVEPLVKQLKELAKSDLSKEDSVKRIEEAKKELKKVMEKASDVYKEELELYGELIEIAKAKVEVYKSANNEEYREKEQKELKMITDEAMVALDKIVDEELTKHTREHAKKIVDEVKSKIEKLKTKKQYEAEEQKSPKKPKNPKKPAPKKVTTVTIKGVTYKIASEKKKIAKVVSANKNIKSINVVNTVKINKKAYKVDEIGNKVFAKNKKLKSVVIGSNIKYVGKAVFNSCKNLKTVKFKGKILKKIGKTTFKGVYKKVKFQAPKKVLKKYKKMIRKAGAPKKAIYKKL